MKFLRRIFESTGFTITRLPDGRKNSIYEQDGLRTIHNHEFFQDPLFKRAYDRGIQAAHGDDYHWQWRIHIGLWAAYCANKLKGDFVECGVNRGFLSSAIMSYLDWNSLNKNFYLLDTFEGIDDRFISDGEREAGVKERTKTLLKSGFYVSGVHPVKANFSEWKNVKIIQGAVPETLDQVDSQEIAYLHIDMNCAEPEIAAVEYFWQKLVPGAFILMDDYAYAGYQALKLKMDKFAEKKKIMIVSLPTGQGIIIKPPN